MSEFAGEILQVNIEDELKQSYLDYAMSVIVGRALPDVRDGLKPVHRRVLFAMNVLGNDYNKPYKKSARVVGDVIGKYHPHGDTAVYDTIVRMAQPFSMRYLLVNGQGNFGSVDGDAPAAMRYTEVRMTRLSHALLADLDKETVDFEPNYDGTELIPHVLPTRAPNLLINGSSGIAVGMATNIPPHNLNEVIDACFALIDKPDLSINELMQYIPGPDFPTAAIINGREGIKQAYRTGRGRVHMRAKHHIEEMKTQGKEAIVVTEIPYQVNKAHLIEKIAQLVKERKIDGITGLRDESDKDGMRIVIELRRGEISEVILNNLYAHTQMQNVFGINMVALDNKGQPRIFNLKNILDAFIDHRREVVTRRTIFELKQARSRAHILEGLSIALANIDEIIALIKTSPNAHEAKTRLLAKVWVPGQVSQMLERVGASGCNPEDIEEDYGLKADGYYLSSIQAQAILDLKLHRLTGLEQEKIFEEYKQIIDLIGELLEVLGSPEKLMAIIRQELVAIKDQFGDKRRTEIRSASQELTLEDLISEEDMVVTLSHEGYVKAQPLSTYRSQRRGGRGKSATNIKEEDFIEKLIIASTHDTILCFSSSGKVYWLKVFQLPQAARAGRGKPIINLLPLEKNERISAVLPIKEFTEDQFVFMATVSGTVKKVSLSHFSRPRSSGIIAIDLIDADQLVGVELVEGLLDVMLFTDAGKVIRFNVDQVRATGRTARGIRGIRLKESQQVIALAVIRDEEAILTATEFGYGKRTAIEEYRITGRGGQGVISIQVNERNGKVVGAIPVIEADEVMLISDRGTLVRTPVTQISVIGRNTQGVRLVNLAKGEMLVGVERVEELEGEEEEGEEGE